MRRPRPRGPAGLLLAALLAGCGTLGPAAGPPTPDAAGTATAIARVDGTSVAMDDATAQAQATTQAGRTATPPPLLAAATSTPLPTSTPVPTSAPVPTSTAVATTGQAPAPTATATPYLANFAAWPTITPTAETPVRVSYDAAAKQYTIVITNPNWHQSYIEFLPESLPFKNFILDVDAHQAGGSSNGDIGVVFDTQPKGTGDIAYVRYNLLLSSGRKLVIVSHTDANDKGTLLGSTPFSALKIGTPAHIELICRDGKATITLNGQPVATYPVPITDPGAVGLTVVGGDTAGTFSNLRITPLP